MTVAERIVTTGQADLSALLGQWINSNADTEWIARFDLAQPEPGRYTLRVWGAREPEDWGELEILTYDDNINEWAFCADYDLGFMEARLAANTNKGLVVIAAFFNFKDGSGRTNMLCREFFYRPPTP